MTDKPKKPELFVDTLGPDPTRRAKLANSTSMPAGATIKPEELAPILFERLMTRHTFINVPDDAYSLVTSIQDLPANLQVISEETLRNALKIVTDAINNALNDGSGLYEDAEIFLSKDRSTLGISFDGGLEPDEILAALTTQQTDITKAITPVKNSGTSVRIPTTPTPQTAVAVPVQIHAAQTANDITDLEKHIVEEIVATGTPNYVFTQDPRVDDPIAAISISLRDGTLTDYIKAHQFSIQEVMGAARGVAIAIGKTLYDKTNLKTCEATGDFRGVYLMRIEDSLHLLFPHAINEPDKILEQIKAPKAREKLEHQIDLESQLLQENFPTEYSGRC